MILPSGNSRAIPEDEIWTKVTILTLSIYQELENWAEAQKYARNLRYEFSDEVDWWMADAYATRRCESTAARSISLKV